MELVKKMTGSVPFLLTGTICVNRKFLFLNKSSDMSPIGGSAGFRGLYSQKFDFCFVFGIKLKGHLHMLNQSQNKDDKGVKTAD